MIESHGIEAVINTKVYFIHEPTTLLKPLLPTDAARAKRRERKIWRMASVCVKNRLVCMARTDKNTRKLIKILRLIPSVVRLT